MEGCKVLNIPAQSVPVLLINNARAGIYKNNDIKKKVKNIREKEEKNKVSPLKVDMPLQLTTVRETIENIKRSSGLFMLSEIVTASTAINKMKPLIWNGLHWVAEPSRWLRISNFPFESEYFPDLKLLFEAYGDVREMHCGSNGFAYVFYYDIRDAIKAQNLL